MENKINIAEILCDMPKGTSLWSMIFGECTLEKVNNTSKYPVVSKSKNSERLAGYGCSGRFKEDIKDSECILFPSSKMRDWTKFFKRGDVVIDKVHGVWGIFEGWKNDDYTKFAVTFVCYGDGTFEFNRACLTKNYSKATDDQRTEFIAKAEKYYKGKYNPDTLKVEAVEPEYQFKPYDKVLVRDSVNDIWCIDFFERMLDDSCPVFSYKCMNSTWKHCIPYKSNEHLLGTKDDPNN